jgi:O-antigen/teichoic acid export membrane protein
MWIRGHLDLDLKERSLVSERRQGQWPAPLLARKAAASSADVRSARPESDGVWTKALRNVSETHVLAVLDQVVVSGTSFLALVMIGRATSAGELGVYALSISLLIWLLTSQEALITIPYTVQQHRPQGTPTEHAGDSLTLSGLLSALATVMLGASALGMSALHAPPEMVGMTWALAAVAPFALLREFGRRFAFAQLRAGTALMLDVAAAATQLGVLGLLAWTDRLSASTALAAIAVGGGLAGTAWLFLARGNFAVRGDQLPKTMRQSWSLGKWLLATQLMVMMQVQINYWLLAWIADTTATGVYAACMSVASLANPMLLGSANILNARAALALKEGSARLRREAIRDSLLLGMAMIVFCASILFAGNDLMHLLYPGQAYADHGHTVMVLALAPLAVALGLPAWSGLTSIGRSREVFFTGSLGVVLTAVLAWFLVAGSGLQGAAYAFLGGTVARSAARWLVFLALAPVASEKQVC